MSQEATITDGTLVVTEEISADQSPDRIADAAEALQILPDETEETAEPEVKEPEEKTEEKTEEKPEEKKEPEKKEPEKAEEPDGYKFAALRRKTKSLEAFETRLDAKMAELETRADAQNKIEALMRSDPEAALALLAEKAGMTADGVMERYVTRRANDGKPGDGEVWDELQRLRKEIADKDTQSKAQAEEVSAHAKQSAYNDNLTRYDQMARNISTVPEAVKRWPALAATDPNVLGPRVTAHAQWAIKNEPDMTIYQLFDKLDSAVKKEYGYYQEHTAPLGQETQTESLEGTGTPVAKPAALSRKTITNDDQAATSARSRPMSQDERLAAAAAVLPDLSPSM